jgi:hypothetical protein
MCDDPECVQDCPYKGQGLVITNKSITWELASALPIFFSFGTGVSITTFYINKIALAKICI